MSEALPRLGRAPETRRRYQVSFAALASKAKKHLGANSQISDLEHVPWGELYKEWNASPTDWNHMRRAVSTFLTATLGDVYHPFRRTVLRAIPLAPEGGGRIPNLSPHDFWRIVEKMPEHAKPCPVVLVATGMRVGEYLRTTTAHLKPAIFGLEVPGTKTGESRATVFVDERLWPWLEAGIPSPLRYGWMRKYWVRACEAAGI